MTTWRRARYKIILHHAGPDLNSWADVDGMTLDGSGLGIHTGVSHEVDVTHLATGRRVAGFPSLGAALAFVDKIVYFVDWSRTPFELSPAETLAIRDCISYILSTDTRPRHLDAVPGLLRLGD